MIGKIIRAAFYGIAAVGAVGISVSSEPIARWFVTTILLVMAVQLGLKAVLVFRPDEEDGN